MERVVYHYIQIRDAPTEAFVLRPFNIPPPLVGAPDPQPCLSTVSDTQTLLQNTTTSEPVLDPYCPGVPVIETILIPFTRAMNYRPNRLHKLQATIFQEEARWIQ